MLKLGFFFVLVVLGLAVLALLAGFIYRAIRQNQNNNALTISTPNGIREEMFIPVGGTDQWVQIRGENRANPVLLFLHGGPGFSYVPFTSAFRQWEKYFTVVLWDQRGAGQTFGRNGKVGTGEMTVNRMSQDGIEVAEYLRRHLAKDKIILFAHSWGTILGLPMIKQRPDLFYAYVGAGQIVDMPRNEAASYDLLLKHVQAAGDTKAVKTLEDIGPPPYKDLDTWMIKGRMIVMKGPRPGGGRTLPNVFTAALFNPNYSLKNSYDLFSAFGYSCKALYSEMMAYDARRLGEKFEIPIFVFQSEFDFQAPPGLAAEFLTTIDAPGKEFVLIKNDTHTAVLSNRDLFLEELVHRVRGLALPENSKATVWLPTGTGAINARNR